MQLTIYLKLTLDTWNMYGKYEQQQHSTAQEVLGKQTSNYFLGYQVCCKWKFYQTFH